MADLSNAFKDASKNDRYEASSVSQHWGQDGQHSRPEDTKQQRQLAAELLGDHTAWNLCGHVAVEEP